ncbi:LOW QUALITY PROTEIN: SH3 domain-containing kinase-binding protein 1-like [Nylanderia fulva]|uniref:LOW QUALITY PROTEIN: SH3 domain-containing kinase-binding protein 1-like n=1 Tax=Nylanderia fulva TaxID=613905 RepID=UPI0010FBB5A9|nr:LOW QUALITY PROTEIN: SH3 domain-containing kinase-binding protein 1-like [Nylanderia fulva]
MEAIVEYNYVAQEDDELTLRKGDIITEIKMMLGGWWEGTLRDKRGMFPDNFVRVLDSSTTGNGSNSGSSETVNSTKSDKVTLRNGSGRRFCKVLFSYEPCNEDELSLVPQDSIEFLGKMEEGWWKGRLKGRVGVFPSNFVSAPAPEEQERHKEQRDKKEMCRVLFPYEAANEDELTLVEGDVITLLSKDAPDKGWWKGELKGQVGLFPDNFVEIIDAENESQEQESQWHEVTSQSIKSTTRHSHQAKKVEKAHIRKSLDTSNVHSSNISDHFPAIDTTIRKSMLPVMATSVSTSSVTATGSGGDDKKAAGSHSIILSLKRFVSDVGNNNGIGNTTSATSECREELDGVERGEGAPLSHLTASRAKAPRRRPPSSQHLRHHAAGSTSVSASSTLPSVPSTLLEDNLSNGRTETEQIPDEETDGLAVKARRKAPWVEELKINQMERKKTAADRIEKTGSKKERYFSRIATQGNVTDSVNKPENDNDDVKPKVKSPRADTNPHADHSPGVSSGQPAYVPYALYSKLLERVAALEEKQAELQVTVGQLSEQLVPLLANASINNKV